MCVCEREREKRRRKVIRFQTNHNFVVDIHNALNECTQNIIYDYDMKPNQKK